MKDLIKTKIDGVPVELQIINVGPSTPESINQLQKNLAQEENIDSKIAVVKVSKKNEENKTTNTTQLIENLFESINSIPKGKFWWQSKTIWVNVIAILAAIISYFGMPVDLDSETSMAIATIILGAINLFLRNKTHTPILKK